MPVIQNAYVLPHLQQSRRRRIVIGPRSGDISFSPGRQGRFSARKSVFPSLRHRKEGWLRHQELSRRPEADAAGMVFHLSVGKPPRPRFQRMLRSIFLIARPPLLAVMQGGDYCAFAPVAPFTRSANTVYS